MKRYILSGLTALMVTQLAVSPAIASEVNLDLTEEERTALGYESGDLYLDMLNGITEAVDGIQTINDEKLQELAEAWMKVRLFKKLRREMRNARQVLRSNEKS
ncbi:MAG: hypothetical protein KDD70_06960 [Bdellovibrionales bacterium]|nr:hypothetical protein [Bdellovibrionales bacterium]